MNWISKLSPLALLFYLSTMKIVTSLQRWPVLKICEKHFHSVSVLQAKQKSGSDGGKAPKKSSTTLVSIEYADSELWKLEPIIDILRKGGVGVIPTDTCYSFVTSVSSKEGMEKLMNLKGTSGKKKPLSVLCKDLPTISTYTSDLSDQKWVYKLLKTTLPGPFTYILPASKEFPKQILKSDGHVKRWKRKEIGVKMPLDEICAYIMDALDEPLICGSVPEDAEDELGILSISSIVDVESADEASSYDSEDDADEGEGEGAFSSDYASDITACKWFPSVDFVVENGPRGLIIDETSDRKKSGRKRISLLGGLSTIVDLTTGRPVILRQGRGELDVDDIQT